MSLPQAHTQSHAQRGIYTALYLGGCILLVWALAFFFFSGQSLRLDEAQSLWQTSRSPGEILTIIARDVHVPLYHELLHVWRVLFGGSVEVARLMSLLFYTLAIPALYFLGKLAYGRNAGLFAAGLLAISPFMNWYGSEIRMYTLFTLLVMVNQYCFIRLWKPSPRTGEGAGGGHTWALYTLSAILGLFTHYFFALTLAAQAIFYLFRRPLFPEGTTKRLIISWGLVGLSFVPWAAFVLLQGQASFAQPTLPVPTSVNLFNAFSQFFFGFQDDHLNTFLLSLWPVTLILGFLALRKTRRVAPETEYLALTVVAAVAIAFVVSFTVPVFASRYLIFTVPSLYLLLASLFSLYPRRAATVARTAVATLMAVMLAVEIINPATPVKENYREAAEYLTTHASAQDVVVLSAPFTIYPVEYYYRGPAPIETLPRWDRYAYGPIPAFNGEALPQDAAELAEHHQHLWLLLSYDQGYQDTVREYFDTHYERVLARTFSPELELYVYKLRYDTPLSQIPPGFSLGAPQNP